MQHGLRVAFDRETERHAAEIAKLANERMAKLAKEWKRRRNSSLSIKFGMGTEFITINGEAVDPLEVPEFVEQAINEVGEITGWYKIAAPDDVEVK